jgi:hypothetical protein
MMARYEYTRAYQSITGQPPAALPEDTLQEIARVYRDTGPVAARKAAENSVYIEKTGDVPRLRGGGLLDMFSKPHLDDLRKNPDAEMAKSDFMLDPQGYRTTPGAEARSEIGGPCTLTETGTTNGVTRLKVTNDPNGKDYYFPWVNRGVGEVNVPKDAPDGTMVVTGGMNGCGLLVTDEGSHYNFYHNADNCRLGDAEGCVKPAKGNVVCSVEPKDYLGRVDAANMGQRIVEEDPTAGKSYFHQMVMVKNEGTWKVYDSGIIMGPGKAGGLGDPIQSFQQSPTKLLTSFPKGDG